MYVLILARYYGPIKYVHPHERRSYEHRPGHLGTNKTSKSDQIWYIGSSRQVHREDWPARRNKTIRRRSTTDNKAQTIRCDNEENIPLRAFLLGVMAVAEIDPLFTLSGGLMNSAGTS